MKKVTTQKKQICPFCQKEYMHKTVRRDGSLAYAHGDDLGVTIYIRSFCPKKKRAEK